MESSDPSALPETHARISAQSQRQAMDWSLVLASQDIHPIIVSPQETDGRVWGLLVDPSQYDLARTAIQQYRLENRGWAWRHELPGAALEVHVGALFWCLGLAFVDWFVTFVWPVMDSAGRMDSLLVRQGEAWRLFTAVTLHADLAHLLGNVSFGVIILGFAMARFGPGFALLATFIAGALGNVAGLLLYSRPYTGVGASGMMMGALGLLSIHSFSLWRQSAKAARYVFSGVIAGFLLFVLFGFHPGSDILAHFGGFVAGIVMGALLSLAPPKVLEEKSLNVIALLLLLSTVGIAWAFALK